MQQVNYCKASRYRGTLTWNLKSLQQLQNLHVNLPYHSRRLFPEQLCAQVILLATTGLLLAWNLSWQAREIMGQFPTVIQRWFFCWKIHCCAAQDCALRWSRIWPLCLAWTWGEVGWGLLAWCWERTFVFKLRSRGICRAMHSIRTYRQWKGKNIEWPVFENTDFLKQLSA